MPLLPTSRNGLAIRIVLAASLTVPAAVTVSASASAAAGGAGQTARAAARAGHRTVTASTAGTLLAWGQGSDGQLGNGHRAKVQLTPVRVRLPRGVTVTSVRAGCDHTLALTSTGRVLAWGFNGDGELGDGSRKSTDTPVWAKLPKGAKIAAIRAGCDHSLALTTAGRVLAWGLNEFGELGTGNKRRYTTPVAVKFARRTRIKAISAGCDHSLALTTRDPRCWPGAGACTASWASAATASEPVRSGYIFPRGPGSG